MQHEGKPEMAISDGEWIDPDPNKEGGKR